MNKTFGVGGRLDYIAVQVLGKHHLPNNQWLSGLFLFCFWGHHHQQIVWQKVKVDHTIHGVLKARILKCFALPFSSGLHFVRTLHHDPSILGGPPRHGSKFHWVRQGCGPCDQIGQFSVTVMFSLSALWWRRIRGLWKLLDGRDWLRGTLGLVPI